MAERKANKILLYYNAHAGSGVFKNNLDHIVARCQEAGYQVMPVRAAMRAIWSCGRSRRATGSPAPMRSKY